MERRDWTVSQRAVAYLVCDGIVNADKYYPQEIAEWARGLMVGEGRVGIELIRGAVEERNNQHTALVEQRDRLVQAIRDLRYRHRQKAKESSFGDCGCDDCIFLQPHLNVIDNALAAVEQGDGRESRST